MAEIEAKTQVSRYNSSISMSRNLLMSIGNDPEWKWAEEASKPLDAAVAAMDKYLLEQKYVMQAITTGLAQVKKENGTVPRSSQVRSGQVRGLSWLDYERSGQGILMDRS